MKINGAERAYQGLPAEAGQNWRGTVWESLWGLRNSEKQHPTCSRAKQSDGDCLHDSLTLCHLFSANHEH